jgi:uncharacterized membrane protein
MLAADIHFAPAALFYLLDMLGVMFWSRGRAGGIAPPGS